MTDTEKALSAAVGALFALGVRWIVEASAPSTDPLTLGVGLVAAALVLAYVTAGEL